MRYPTHSELLEFSAEDRLRLLEDVWDTFSTDTHSLPLSEQHRHELDLRLENMQQSPDAVEPWSAVRERIARKA